MKVKDAMHRNTTWVNGETPVHEIAETMRKQDIGAIPVGENDRLIGMVTDRDIALRTFDSGRDPGKVRARDIMSKGVVYCREDEKLEDAVKLMQSKKIRRLPVLSENKRLVGMLSLGDVAHAAPSKVASETLSAVSAHHA